jgi:hypothetical protein
MEGSNFLQKIMNYLNNRYFGVVLDESIISIISYILNFIIQNQKRRIYNDLYQRLQEDSFQFLKNVEVKKMN